MIHFDSSYLTIHWNDDIGCVVMQWKEYAEQTDFRNGLNDGLDLLIHRKSSKWLADLRYLGVVAQEDQEWSNKDWFPRAIEGGIKYMAIVVPHNIISKWSVNSIMRKVENTEIIVHYFDDLEKAKEWLRDQT